MSEDDRARVQGGRQGLGPGRRRQPPPRRLRRRQRGRRLVRRRPQRLRRPPRGPPGRGRLDLPHHPARRVASISARLSIFLAGLFVVRGKRAEAPPPTKESQMRFMMFMYPEIEEKDWEPDAGGGGGDGPLQRGAAQGRACCSRSTGCGRPATAASSASTAGQGDDHRRALRGGEGGRRRLLADPGALQGGGAGVGRPLPGRRTAGSRCGACFEMEDFPQEVQDAYEGP